MKYNWKRSYIATFDMPLLIRVKKKKKCNRITGNKKSHVNNEDMELQLIDLRTKNVHFNQTFILPV
jgi:hypothetical protein